MIVVCPSCAKRYALDDARLAAGPRRLRCSGCGHVFVAGQQAGAAVPAGAAAGALALVADEAREFRDLVRRTLEALGCRVETTDDGEAAFRFAVERRPALMVLNVYLRRLLGVAVCEGLKGSPDLKRTRVALVGSVFKSDRFVRGPGNLYGADDYFEDVIPEADLRRRLARLLGRPAGAGPAGARPAPAAPGGRQARADGARRGPEPEEEIRRLARIMLSDLKIYYPDRFASAVAGRRVFENFREELAKGKDLIAHRFPDIPNRIEILAAALKEGILEERSTIGSDPAGSPA